MNCKVLLAACWIVIAANTVFAQKNKPAGEAHVYKKVGDRELKLYVSKPADWTARDNRPALVFFHGGGWVGGSPASFNEHCKYFASRGLVTFTVEYRLLNKETKEPPVICVQDAKSAMRWVRSRAKEFGIDPKRIGAAGGSAGGHLAAFCGMVEGKDDPQDDLAVSPKANALVLFNPVFDNGPGQWGHPRVTDSYKEFSPAHNITPDDPPTVIFLGSEDKLISVESAQKFQKELQNAKVRCDLHLYDGQGHGFYHLGKANGNNYYQTVTAADKFLGSLGWLKGSPTLSNPGEKTSAR